LSGKIPIAPSGGFSVETLIGLTPSWKTELNRSISTVEDGISGGLQHHHEMCCEKVAAMEGGLVWFRGGFTVGMLFPDRWTCI